MKLLQNQVLKNEGKKSVLYDVFYKKNMNNCKSMSFFEHFCHVFSICWEGLLGRMLRGMTLQCPIRYHSEVFLKLSPPCATPQGQNLRENLRENLVNKNVARNAAYVRQTKPTFVSHIFHANVHASFHDTQRTTSKSPLSIMLR